MPVDIDRFERTDPLRQLTTSERIVRFLAVNDAQAFTRREIAEAVDRDPETVGTNLTRLKGRGLVRHRAPYWAFIQDRALARQTLEERSGAALAAAVLGEPAAEEPPDERAGIDPSNPSAHAIDQRAHRQAAQDFFDRVLDRLDDAIEACHLFGSVARGVATASSDVDVLVVVADDADFAAVDDVLLELAYAVQLEHEVRIEVHSITASEFSDRRDRGDPFLSNVLSEADAGG